MPKKANNKGLDWKGIAATIVTTVIGGVVVYWLTTGLLQLIKPPDNGQPNNPPNVETINKAITDLDANSMQTRIAAISTLETIGVQASDVETKKMIITRMEEYIRNNILNRKTPGDGIREDRGRYKSDDIDAVLNALQSVRKSSTEKLEVELRNINFDRIDLTRLDLSGFDFSFSTFQEAFLSHSDWSYVNFDHADLANSAIWNANMSGATFYQTDLQGAKFANVILENSTIEQASNIDKIALFGEIKGLTSDQWAIFNEVPQN